MLPIWARIPIGFVEIIIAVAFAYLTMATNVGYWVISPLMMALYLGLLIDGIIQILFSIIALIIKMEKDQIGLFLNMASCLATVIYLIIGMVSMQIVKPKNISFQSEKLQHTYTVAFVSDLHIGSSQLVDTSVNTINMIREQNPDFTIIGGDFVDEYTKKEDMVKVVAAFKEYTKPVYFIHGNHELTGNVTMEELEQELTNNGVNVLVDEFAVLAPDLTLLGREDLSSENRKEISTLVNPTPTSCLLVADHKPFNFEDNCKMGIDFQLSGHTHAGQLFPLKTVYGFAVHSYGTYQYEGAYLNVSAGASGWQNPLRTEGVCEFEIVTLSPKA